MNTPSVGLRTFISGAIAVALGYLLALRFGSLWLTLSALPIGIFLYEPTRSLQTSRSLLKALVSRDKSLPLLEHPEVKGFGEGMIILTRFCFVTARYVIAYGLGLLTVWWALMAFSGNFIRGYDIGSFLFFLLMFGGVGLIMILSIRSGPPEEHPRPDWPITRPISTRFPLPKEYTWTFSGKTLVGDLKKQGVLADGDGKYFSLSRFADLLLDTAQKSWSVIRFTLKCAGYALTLPVSLGIVVVDAILSLLFKITTHASIGAGIGGFVGAFFEYLYYPHFETTGEDILRFVLFMALGGLLGVGLYRLRELASKEAVKPVVVSGV